MALFEQHYPEFLTKFIVINAPAAFNALFAIVKPLMREETRKKNIILGSKLNGNSKYVNTVQNHALTVVKQNRCLGIWWSENRINHAAGSRM